MLGAVKTLLLMGQPAAAAVGVAAMSRAYLGKDESEVDAATYDLSLNLGAAGAKTVILWVWASFLASQVATTPTIGGETPTLIGGDTTGARQLSAYELQTSLGGAQTVHLAYDGAAARVGIAGYSILNSAQTTYHARSGSAVNSGSSITGISATAIEIPAGGLGFAAAWVGSASASVTWTPSLTPDLNEQLGTSTLWGSCVSTDVAGASVAFNEETGVSSQHRIFAFSWAA